MVPVRAADPKVNTINESQNGFIVLKVVVRGQYHTPPYKKVSNRKSVSSLRIQETRRLTNTEGFGVLQVRGRPSLISTISGCPVVFLLLMGTTAFPAAVHRLHAPGPDAGYTFSTTPVREILLTFLSYFTQRPLVLAYLIRKTYSP